MRPCVSLPWETVNRLIFWSQSRLLEHFRRRPSCLAIGVTCIHDRRDVTSVCPTRRRNTVSVSHRITFFERVPCYRNAKYETTANDLCSVFPSDASSQPAQSSTIYDYLRPARQCRMLRSTICRTPLQQRSVQRIAIDDAAMCVVVRRAGWAAPSWRRRRTFIRQTDSTLTTRVTRTKKIIQLNGVDVWHATREAEAYRCWPPLVTR